MLALTLADRLQVLSLLILLFLIGNVRSNVPRSELYPFLVSDGCTALDFGDDTSHLVDLENYGTFSYFQNMYNSVYINSNGILSFRKGMFKFSLHLMIKNI